MGHFERSLSITPHSLTCTYSIASYPIFDLWQRIESRFSRNPIRMTGRVVSSLRGEAQGSSRFIMVLKRR
jgi:hypothetical protein